MEEIFIKWKRYVLDHAEEFRIEDENLSSSEYYVGNTKVCLYSGNPVFNAGDLLLMDRWKDLSISMISWRLDMLCRDAPPSHFSEKIMCSDKGSFG